MKVGIFGQALSEKTKVYVKVLLDSLEKQKADIIIEEKFYGLVCNLNAVVSKEYSTFTELEGLDRSIELMFTLGGDGTILGVLSYIKDLEIPIVGINTGRLGFMATISKEDIDTKVNAIFAGDYKVKDRSLLELKTSDEVDGILYSFALNEIAINRKETTAMVTVDAYLNGEFLNSYWGDGVIIATPTGSTGYSLSCGGPIIMPGSDNLVITPIAPHNLYARPFVIPDDTEIELHIKGRAESYLVSLDSRAVTVPHGIKLRIKKSNFVIKMVRFEELRFLKTLRKKMLWGEDYRNE
ncbi:MAG: NAD kinase [Flavobacteriales bacterium]|nr:NAD kinase [Flavobacteriales bacterium]